VILTTQVNLDHHVFSKWFALFESLFPLEIQLLSPWFNISSFRRLQMATWSHINDEILEHRSYTVVRVPFGGRARAWRDWFVVFGSNRCKKWRCNVSQPPACFIIVICRFPFWHKITQKTTSSFSEIQTILTLQAVSHFPHHMLCLSCIMKNLWGLWVWTQICDHRPLQLGSTKYYWCWPFLDGETTKTDPSIHSTDVLDVLGLCKGMCRELFMTDSNSLTLAG